MLTTNQFAVYIVYTETFTTHDNSVRNTSTQSHLDLTFQVQCQRCVDQIRDVGGRDGSEFIVAPLVVT